MFDDEPNALADAAASSESEGSVSEASSGAQVSDITTESQETQVEAAAAENREPAAPAPSAAPKKSSKNRILAYEQPVYHSPIEAVEDLIAQVNKSLTVNEDLMMAYIEKDEISESYYKLWRDDANLYFRSLCILRKRLGRMRARAAAKSESQAS